MLVLLSFGLVLLATILLVVGLLNDDGITLIYLSIAASATAAVVLFVAFRRARPTAEAVPAGPAPLGDDLGSVVHDDRTSVMADTPAAPVPPATAPTPAPAPTPEPEPEPVGAPGDAWADDTDWEDEDVQFPIADYDELSVAEIMPLLPQLYSDELDIVAERERSTKNRSTILARLDKLKETGTEADAEELAAAGAADEVEEAPAAPAPATGPAPSPVSLLDDEDEDEGAFFPIADYDDLSVSQIVPLLPQLEHDELEDVRAREQAGANRTTLLAEIDRHLRGEGLEPAAWSTTAGADAEDEEVAAERAPAPARASLPIDGYDDMTVAEIRPRLGDLSDDELAQVLEHEVARDNRSTIVAEINRRLDAAPAAAPAKRAAKKATGARKAPAKKATERKATKRKARATKKQAASRFPIANYDELNVADIRPRLTKLSRAQLEQVRERELTGAGRKTILDDIDNRLS